MVKAVVTGCAGFIGGHLTETLLKSGWTIIGVDNMSSGLQSTMDSHLLSDSFKPIYLDVAEEGHRARIRSQILDFEPEYFFHLAAIPGVVSSVNDPAESNRANVTGLLNMLDLARECGVKKFVFSSSSSVYGGKADFPTSEEASLNPMSPYALQKKMGEEYCKLYSDLYGLDTVSLRYFNVFGPRQRADSAYAAAISAFCNSFAAGVPPTIYGDGSQTRDFCFVSNVVAANILAATSERQFSGDVFNIGCGGRVSVNDVCEALGTLPPIYKKERPGDVKDSQADISKANKHLGYYPRMSYDHGLQITLDWFLTQKDENNESTTI